ncbi:MAG: hypothetical protein CM15mP8_1240 [Methanobacteriota archaeon]|nr:MAG: hypothetical protein CM15mP8_1240 [Euryarchaeota archaeon]
MLFGFYPNIPLEDQVDGWGITEPDAEQLAELGLAGRAWLKKPNEKWRRFMMLMPPFTLHHPATIDEAVSIASFYQ